MCEIGKKLFHIIEKNQISTFTNNYLCGGTPPCTPHVIPPDMDKNTQNRHYGMKSINTLRGETWLHFNPKKSIFNIS